MKLKIIVNSKEFKEFKSFPISIGRRNDNDLILNDQLISRIHCTIFQDSNLFYIADLKSTNGTIVNGKKISKSVLLFEEDKILIGKTFLQIII
tara:strand:- start:47 stop:325 length:279 start_codon:yes stop_codon:yes gene_type:complete